MTFSEAANLEQVWWEQNISENSRSLIELPITDTIFTDGSSMGWGASSQFGKINGRQIDKERDLHIDNLELLAILINFESFKINFLRKHVKIMSDSAIAISHINNVGGSKSITYHEIAKKVWERAKMQGIWISAAHIPGQKNIDTDKIQTMAVIDLFATRANKKINRYISWKPDADSIFTDVFSVTQEKYFNYCFPLLASFVEY